MLRHAFLYFLTWSVVGRICLAEPFLDRLWPPVLQRGQTTRVECFGNELQQAVGVWTSAPGVLIVGTSTGMATEDAVTLDVSVPADAPLGLYGLRLATANGLSNVHLFLIDELSPTLTNPTTSDLTTIPTLSLPCCLAAPVRKARVDRYAFDVAGGQRLAFEVIGNRLGKNFDPVVTIRDAQGRFVARCDNSIGLLFDCRFAHTFEAAGNYLIEVADARYAGEASWNYVLRIGEFPAARTAVPAAVPAGQDAELTLPEIAGLLGTVKPQSRGKSSSYFEEVRTAPGKPATWIPLAVTTRPILIEREPNDAPNQALTAASPIALSAELCGVLYPPGDEDWFQFPLAKGQTLRVRSFTQAIGSAADLELMLFEPSNEPGGREVARSDETNTFDNSRNTTFVEDANLNFSARTDGLHRLLVRDLAGAGGPAHTYRVEISDNSPELKLKADVSEIAVPRGTWQPVPLSITRTGFNGPLELELVGAPPGVDLEPKVIPAEVKDFVCRLSASNDAVEGLATLQLVGRAKVDDRVVECTTAVHPLIDRQLMNKDRILYALRPDQRELPPSLTDRIALQILPPAPFDFDLPDQQVLLPKYQTAPIRIETRRADGFAAPISFTARGGQLGDEREERVQIYFRAPDATPQSSSILGVFANRILTQYQKHRVDVLATATLHGRTVNLTRTFQIDVRPAFEPKFEPAEITLLPGEKLQAKLLANRVPTYEGELVLTLQNPQPSLNVPEQLSLPQAQAEITLEATIKPETNPGRYELRYEANAYVGRFQETVRSAVLVVHVKKPETK